MFSLIINENKMLHLLLKLEFMSFLLFTFEKQPKIKVFYLSSISGNGVGHDTFQVTAETDTLHWDDGFLSQYCPKNDINLDKN